MSLVDMANGVAHRQCDAELLWAFPNLDLQIHMLRQPSGRWLGLEAVQQYSSDGIGLSSAVLHDEHGPFGRSEQILTLRPMAQPLWGEQQPSLKTTFFDCHQNYPVFAVGYFSYYGGCLVF